MDTASPNKSQEEVKAGTKNLEDKIRALMRKKDEVIGKVKLTLKLEFGHIHASSYNNHGTQVKGIIWNENLNCFASYDEK